MTLRFDVVAAIDEKRGLAKDGDLPWHLPGDLKHFSKTTTETADPDKRNAAIMGSKTWESLPVSYQPLPGRRNIVISRRAEFPLPKGVALAASLDEALALCELEIDRALIEKPFVVGGGVIYEMALAHPQCGRLILTRIHADFDCDTLFPEYDTRFSRSELVAQREEKGIRYDIEVWQPAKT